MQATYSPIFELPLPAGHRFPMSKYRLLYEQVARSADQLGIRLHEAPIATRRELALAHTPDYIDRVFAGELSRLEQRRIGFPWSNELVERSTRSTGGTIASAQASLDQGLAINLAGGTHHAAADRGQGFCVFNDVAVAIRVLQRAGLAQTAVVIDCDVHQGNGTAEIFASDADVFTCSLHGAANFPFTKFGSDLDIALPDKTGDAEYLRAVERAFTELPLDSADIAFYLAGADPYEHDRYGRLSLSQAGLAERDERVIAGVTAQQVPLVIVMAGGYSPNVAEIADLHMTTVTIAARHAQAAKKES